MERRLSPLVAGIGLIGALAWFGLGASGRGTTSAPDTAPLAADVDAHLRETIAGVQARADTLGQLPRLGLAVATDERTVRDLTTDELAFRTKAGEHIEIAQIARQGGKAGKDGAVHSLLRLPDDKLPLAMASLGPHLMIADGRLQVVVYVSVTPRDRADELRGALAVAQAVDFTAFGPRLNALGLAARLEVAGQAMSLLGGEAPTGQAGAPLPLATAAPEATTLSFVGAASEGGAPAGRRPIVGPLVLLLVALAAAAALRARGAAAALPAAVPVAPVAFAPSAPQALEPATVPRVASTPPLGRLAESRPTVSATPSAGVPQARTPPFGRQVEARPAAPPTPSAGVRAAPTPPLVRPAEARPIAPATPSAGLRVSAPPAATGAPLPIAVARGRSGPTSPPDLLGDEEPTNTSELSRPNSTAAKLQPPAPHLPPPAPHLPPPVPHLPPPASQLAPSAQLPPPAPRAPRTRTGSPPPRPAANTLPSWLFEVTAGDDRPTSPVSPGAPTSEDALGREYRALYLEFIKMRRTCRESVDNLDADRFIATLRRQRDELIQRHVGNDIRFRLAFDNGKAAIRFVVA